MVKALRALGEIYPSSRGTIIHHSATLWPSQAFAMVYIGIGILAASLSFLLYKHGLSNKLSLYDRWKWRILLQKLRIISDDEFHCDDQSGCNIINVVEGDRCGNAQQTSETDNNSKSSPKSSKPLKDRKSVV